MIVEVWLKCSASWVYKDSINYVFTEPYVYKFFLSAQKKNSLKYYSMQEQISNKITAQK